MPCVYLPGPAPAVTVANKYKSYIKTPPSLVFCILLGDEFFSLIDGWQLQGWLIDKAALSSLKG